MKRDVRQKTKMVNIIPGIVDCLCHELHHVPFLLPQSHNNRHHSCNIFTSLDALATHADFSPDHLMAYRVLCIVVRWFNILASDKQTHLLFYLHYRPTRARGSSPRAFISTSRSIICSLLEKASDPLTYFTRVIYKARWLQCPISHSMIETTSSPRQATFDQSFG